MNCETLNTHLDDFIDRRLDDALLADLSRQAAECPTCARTVAQARALRESLVVYGARTLPMPDDAFFSAAIANAIVAGTKTTRQQYWLKGFSTAMVAGLAVLAVTLFMLRPHNPVDDAVGIPTVSISLEQVRTVNLVFASASDLDDASLTVSLPDGVYLQGFEGQKEITWMTSLTAGRNILPLKLIATTPRGGELLAVLRHEDDDKAFRLQVDIS
ncbi:MAG: hypothetical protein AAGA44_15615 [Pseudomonadota bacterium]